MHAKRIGVARYMFKRVLDTVFLLFVVTYSCSSFFLLLELLIHNVPSV